MRRGSAGVAGVVVAVLVAGCSHGHGGPRTPADYARSVQAVCARAAETSSALTPPASATDLPAVAAYAEGTVRLLATEHDDAARLRAPGGRPATVAAWLADVERRRQVAQSLAWAARAGDGTATAFELVELRAVKSKTDRQAGTAGLPGCGSGPPAPTAPADPKATYLDAANALCAAVSDDIAAADPPRTLPALAGYLADALRRQRDLQTRLAALHPPTADAARLRALAQQKQALIGLLDQARAAAARGDAAAVDGDLATIRTRSAAYDSAADGYGLTSCGGG